VTADAAGADAATDATTGSSRSGRPVAIVTGSAVGIGRALCEVLARRGMHVVGLDVDATENAAMAAAAGESVTAVTCDVGDAVTVKQVVDDVVARTGRVDLLVNNASVWNDTRLLSGGYEQQVAAWHRAMDACSDGAFHCTAAVVPTMVAGGGGVVVNMLTNHIREGEYITGAPATGYDAGKFALWRLTESWAVELRRHGIRVNGLSFGATDTPMLRGVSPQLSATAMRPEDMAEAVCAIVDQGPDGPTGRVWDVGFTGTPHDEALRQIAAIRTDV
jgi:NAD(P)-dependent dehydrogenase (short-subunit alcohol dehydrogenase family)